MTVIEQLRDQVATARATERAATLDGRGLISARHRLRKLEKALARAEAEAAEAAGPDRQTIVDYLTEARNEISRVNRAAGETIFNPAATDGINALIRHFSKG